MIDSVLRTATAALEFTRANVVSSTPWRGVGDLPRKLEGGYPYMGVNIPALLGQLPDQASPAIFGSLAQWGNTDVKVAKGSKGLGFIYMKAFKRTDKTSSLKLPDEDLDVTENGRILVPYASFAAFAQCQTDGYDANAHHPVLEVLKRLQMDDAALTECGNHARDAAQRYMASWMESSNASVRNMSEGERCFIIHLAADLVVGFNSGSMALAGELNLGYPALAQEAVKAMIGKQIMRPWGIACDILRQLSPVFDANVTAGLEAAKLKQEEYKKKYAKPVIAKTPCVKGDESEASTAADLDDDAVGKAGIVAQTVPITIAATPVPVAKKTDHVPVLKEPELVEFSSDW